MIFGKEQHFPSQMIGGDQLIVENYLDKVYAGFLGMNAGIRLGAPVEPTEWTADRIQRIFGDVKGYLKEYKTFSADDDVNGPVFFMRALYDDAVDRELEPSDVAKAWLNYCREGIGMIWWGGADISTEHRAYTNLVKGIPAPKSGSIVTNGEIMAEQIGGQIFIDTWGWLFPNRIDKAAEYAGKAASVSHDRNGVYGARFIAACISKAFQATSISEILQTGLSVIPKDSTYAQVVHAVRGFHQKNPHEFRACLTFLHENWGYDKYTGVCHIIPNAGVCVLALLYGEGDFARTIEIATMCGWDTDCNAGSVGSIVGVLNGIEKIPEHYRKPINDCVITSSVAGYLNIVDLPTFSKEVVLLGYRLAGEKTPKKLQESVKRGEIYFNFDLPGSTHGFRTNNAFKTLIRHCDTIGEGSLEVIFDRMVEGNRSKIFYKPFYRSSDFSDEKYKPVFSPQAYSGQIVEATIYLDKWQGADILITPYVRNTFTKKDMMLHTIKLADRTWNDITFVIPDTKGAVIDEIGYMVESPSRLNSRALGTLYIDNFHIYGQAKYTIDFSKQFQEFLSVTPFSHHKGKWMLQGNSLRCICEDECYSFTGNYYTKDVRLDVLIEPTSGHSHLLIVRAPGIQRQYLVGFDGKDKVSLIMNDFGFRRLKSIPFLWDHHKSYEFQVNCKGVEIEFCINGERILNFEDNTFSYGMYGFACLEKGETVIHSFRVKEL
ncbi:ADP-ribosylglycohydrolase family protein [Bacillus sp. UNCCL13]|uniref:ADP-ribosylglycohydrolase family protein n=1 Tax=Bacillus sp. UNCCL13 TaxID=1502772 RepID=UPI0034A179D5